MALPNFLGIGAQKAGTTTIHQLLRQHRDIYLHPQKETHFFYWSRHSPGAHRYEYSTFSDYGGQQLIGEISPEYMRVPGAARFVREKLGRIKIVVCLRQPTIRAFSHYLHCLRAAEDNRSFLAACRADAELPLWSDDDEHIAVAYVRGSRYVYQLQEWEREFGRENMFYCVLERDLLRNEAKIELLKRLFEFLGVTTREFRIRLDVPTSGAPAPTVTFAKENGFAGEAGKGAFEAGDIIIRAGWFWRVVRRPSPDIRAFFETMAREMTPTLSEQAMLAVNQTYFADVAERVSEILREDITPFWSMPAVMPAAAAAG